MNPCFQYFANIIFDFDICKLPVHTFKVSTNHNAFVSNPAPQHQ